MSVTQTRHPELLSPSDTPRVITRSSGWRRTSAIALAMWVTAGMTAPVSAQTPPEWAGQPRPLILSPTLRLADVGWDDNVFRVNKSDKPIGDFTATLGPAIRASLQLARVRVVARSEVDFIYFKRVSQIRSVDTDNAGRIELLLGRLRPFAEGNWTNARHRRNFEIDLPVRRVDASVSTGADVRVSGKTSFGATVQRSRADYKGETVYLDTDLSQYLGATSTITTARFRYSATPFTTVGADLSQDKNRFAIIRERNSDGFRLMSVVDFQPLAVVSGHAEIGIRRRTFVDGSFPQFQGTIARANLNYTLLERTRFAVTVQRDLSYSYRADQRDYLQTGIDLSVTQRLASAWDLAASVGRFRLNYDLGSPTAPGTVRDERFLSYAFDVGYHIERTRVGFQVARQTRTSGFSIDRGFEGTRIASSVTYGF